MKTKINEIAVVKRGRHITAQDKIATANPVKTKILTYKNVDLYSENLILKNTIKKDEKYETVCIDFYKKFYSSIVQNQDIILPVNHQNRIAKFIDFNNENDNFVFSDEIIFLKINKDRAEPKFIFYLLNTQLIIDKLNEEKKLSCEKVENLEFKLLNLNEQREFIKQLEKINRKKLEIENELKKLI